MTTFSQSQTRLIFSAVDFDERTADDWDVDMEIYTDPEAGDMDARDFISMRRERRMRQGKSDVTDLRSDGGGIGTFEKHTKVRARIRALFEF